MNIIIRYFYNCIFSLQKVYLHFLYLHFFSISILLISLEYQFFNSNFFNHNFFVHQNYILEKCKCVFPIQESYIGLIYSKKINVKNNVTVIYQKNFNFTIYRLYSMCCAILFSVLITQCGQHTTVIKYALLQNLNCSINTLLSRPII